MRGQFQRRTSLFLMELIIGITFFAFASAVFVRFFVDSKLISNADRMESECSLLLDEVTNLVTAAEGDRDIIKELEPTSTFDEEGKWILSKDVYLVKTKFKMEEHQILNIESAVYKDDKMIFSRETKYHIPYNNRSHQ